ncbi:MULTISPECIES: DUF3951 domain-containing protein [Bacillus]|uniref:DUF3951 domain-containing protein n=1 Tax=Bacillus TaxID=1386 RepID=UPI0003197908|nr:MULTISPECIES: DUF3951 domain-containing protein [Bacillus]
MDPMIAVAYGLPLTIVIIVLIGFYKMFVKKKNITAFYTPFDHITGQTVTEFHEEQKVIVEDEEQGDGKRKNK